MATNMGMVIVAAISPFRKARDQARELIGDFVEVHLARSLEDCIKGDVKGLYAVQLAGSTGHQRIAQEGLSPLTRSKQSLMSISSPRPYPSVRRAAGIPNGRFTESPALPNRGAMELNRCLATVLRIASEVLKHPVMQEDGFFSLGGDSLLAVELMTMLEAELRVEFDEDWLFYADTFMQIAEHIVAKSARTEAERTEWQR